MARQVDDSKAQLQLSQKALEAAVSRMKILDQILRGGDSDGDQPSFVIDAPQKGIIRAMHVMPGEVVTAGAPLFEVMNTETLWIRVPVYVGEIVLDIAAESAGPEVGDLASRPGQSARRSAADHGGHFPRQRHRDIRRRSICTTNCRILPAAAAGPAG